MNGIIIQPANPKAKEITLQTKRGECIQNEQCEIFSWEKAQFKRFQDAWPLVQERCDPTGVFNCHGLTFASRRTCISDSKEIAKILMHDDCLKVAKSSVLPGDVILYMGEKGDIEHSGIVVGTTNSEDNFGIPLVVSKWGKFREFIHRANQCPYNYLTAIYFRISK